MPLLFCQKLPVSTDLEMARRASIFTTTLLVQRGFFSVQYSLQINMQLCMFFPTISTKTHNGYPFSEFPLFS